MVGDLKAFAAMPRLQTLRLRQCSRVFGDLAGLGRGCPRLACVDAHGCVGLACGSLAWVRGCNQLHTLDLGRCGGAQGDVHGCAAANLLRTLVLAHNPKLSGSIEGLAGLPRLKLLDCSACPNLTGAVDALAPLHCLEVGMRTRAETQRKVEDFTQFCCVYDC